MKQTVRLPEWLRTNTPRRLHDTKRVLRKYRLVSVCEEARCPNIGQCFMKPTAAFMIMGSRCSRNCGFCSVRASVPEPLDHGEPERIGEASRELQLRYVVITSVTRDDLPDGGAGHFAATVRALKKILPGARVEVLTPDFKGLASSVDAVLDSAPDVFNHNIETVPRLYPSARPLADYRRSLTLLEHIKQKCPDTKTKSGLMLGLGEQTQEVLDVLRDLRDTGCDYLTVGQYLRPSRAQLPVREYIRPEVFARIRDAALAMGFRQVFSGPLIRSSMNAEDMYNSSDMHHP